MVLILHYSHFLKAYLPVTLLQLSRYKAQRRMVIKLIKNLNVSYSAQDKPFEVGGVLVVEEVDWLCRVGHEVALDAHGNPGGGDGHRRRRHARREHPPLGPAAAVASGILENETWFNFLDRT